MAYTYELPNMSGGFDSSIASISHIVPIFVPMVLFSVYCIVTIGGMLAQKAKTGYSDTALWSTLGGLGTMLVALPMSIVNGVIEPTYLIITTLVTIFSGIWLFLDQNRNEIN